MAAAASSSHGPEVLLAAAKRALGSDFRRVDAVDASGRTALAWAAAAPIRARHVSSSSTRMRQNDSATVDGLSVLHLASRTAAVAYLVDVKSFDVDQRALTEKRPA